MEILSGASPALVIVDMQNYYLRSDSSYYRYFNFLEPGCLDYIITRCENIVIPNIRLLIEHFRKRSMHLVFLRLCGKDPERKDLHKIFMEIYQKGRRAGFDDIYPLVTDHFSDIVDALEPLQSETVITKTTFSPFTFTSIDDVLRKMGIGTLVFAGLATSQCVETTARDASDRGYHIVHIEDAQADYDELSHNSSLYSSQGVCGGHIMSTANYLEMNE